MHCPNNYDNVLMELRKVVCNRWVLFNQSNSLLEGAEIFYLQSEANAGEF